MGVKDLLGKEALPLFAKKPCSSVSLVEFGFLFSVFFEPWGPVFRYFGWFLCLIGVGILVFRGGKKELRAFIEPFTKKIMLVILLWSLIVTVLNSRGLYFDLKGFSMLLEAFFAVWLSSFVITKYEGALFRLISVWTASFVCVLCWVLWAALAKNHFAGPFSNMNTMGIYSVVVLPVILFQAFKERKNICLEMFFPALFALSLLLVFLSFSSCAWIAGAFTVGIFLFLMFLIRPGKRQLIRVAAVSCVFFALFACFFVFADVKASAYAKREISQILSFNKDFTRFTTHRNIIWKSVVGLWKEKPFIGWGWSDFKHLAEDKIGKLPRVGVPHEPHNVYLELLVRGGVLLPFLAVTLFMRGAWCGYKKMKESKNFSLKLLYAALIAAIMAQVVYGFGGSILMARQKVGFLFWVLFGIAVSERGGEVLDERQSC
ncbi:O-antigen ligase [Thermovirga sp.]|uniref:O-antigen ligase family protein n=1 Tax=Thermovirga sp. TaxID=2699834 RepID=UPI0025E989DF|nr:O-antigen ligase family protein [Thermovirga sp.]MBO8154782.1 O-antigen ligase family protein [Thermovirga sp.]